MQTKQLIAVLAIAAAFSAPAQAAQIFSQDEIANRIVQNFDDAAGYDTFQSRVQIGTSLGVDLGLSTAGGQLHFGAPYGTWALGGNGEWTSAKSFAGVDGAYQDEAGGIAASMFFDFGSKTVQSVGALLNYDDSFSYFGMPLQLYMAAYDQQGNLIEDAWFPVSTPAAIDEGTFFGLSSDSANIARFEISAPYAVVDDFSFSAPVPEPETYAMFLAGLGLLGAITRKRRA